MWVNCCGTCIPFCNFFKKFWILSGHIQSVCDPPILQPWPADWLVFSFNCLFVRITLYLSYNNLLFPFVLQSLSCDDRLYIHYPGIQDLCGQLLGICHCSHLLLCFPNSIGIIFARKHYSLFLTAYLTCKSTLYYNYLGLCGVGSGCCRVFLSLQSEISPT